MGPAFGITLAKADHTGRKKGLKQPSRKSQPRRPRPFGARVNARRAVVRLPLAGRLLRVAHLFLALVQKI